MCIAAVPILLLLGAYCALIGDKETASAGKSIIYFGLAILLLFVVFVLALVFISAMGWADI